LIAKLIPTSSHEPTHTTNQQQIHMDQADKGLMKETFFKKFTALGFNPGDREKGKIQTLIAL